ncbi:efflux RND transporter periplasmic adaptor subunit [Methylococcus capsulatus]|jgi:multidrug efflux system membrane fusion protein|uniref:HlyD family secretion protein n=1 Tax=Methylococcus capsulatus TaxID=414 RepID=A0AA35V755_METCP|nr:efflux RND transporter periplasmic adaptor subunit [Methylococcus capsulatus]CAI8848804.1 HlyD family secretion protein [Methylococcus capsulatus]
MHAQAHGSNSRNTLSYAAMAVSALVLMLVWMEGGFVGKAAPGLRAEEQAEPVRGQTYTLAPRTIAETSAWPATVSARVVARISPKVAGRITEITRRVGDRVQRGEVLARLEAKELGARLGQARAQLAAAEAEAVRARAELIRSESLYAKEAATRQTLETAQAAARAANAQVKAAQDAIAEAGSLFGETELKSPVDGTVVSRELDRGDTAMPGMPVLTVQESGRLRIEGAVAERCAGALRAGAPLTARGGSPEQVYPVEVDEVAPAADPATRTVWFKARLPDAATWQPGAYVSVELPCGQREVLLIPAAAVTRIGQIESVRLVEKDRSVLRHIRTGRFHDGQLEVLAGLEPGDTVQIPSP